MSYMHSEWKKRLEHWILSLKKDLYHPLGSLSVESFTVRDHLTPDEAESHTDFIAMPEGTPWGHPWEYCWMRGDIILPDSAEGKRIVMNLPTGGETTVFVDGKSFGTYRASWVQVPHQYIVDNCLAVQGKAGEKYHVLLEAYAGHDYPESELGECATGPVLPGQYDHMNADETRAKLGSLTYGVWNEEAYQLYIDLETLKQLLDQVDPESLRADHLAAALEKATLIIDFEQPEEQRIASYNAARESLKPVLSAVNGSTVPVFYAVGHAHLDLAWLWPMAETHRKTSRTFAAQLRMIEQYPEYKYIQSQPAAYEMCREHYPELFERIREAAKKGQWIPEGASWVEPDTNMTSGESLVRQILYGKRYFKENFGVDSVVLWIPDTFGYSAALPQILNGCGVKYLVTQKIFWSYNEGDRFPYHYFTWQGADGSKIDAFLPTSYNYHTQPKVICETWKKRVQKRNLDSFLVPFGYGDGGGGPTRDDLEYIRRENNLEGMPRVKTASPVEFFQDMEAAGGPAHTYVGELYFSAHRGVYTSQAAIKRGNRKSEIALREAEIWGSLASVSGYRYPAEKLETVWKKLLLNQFHDILPGSSIARVYEEARKDHQWIIHEADSIRDEAYQSLLSGEGITVFNSLSFDREDIIRLPESYSGGAVTASGTPVPVQNINRKTYAKVRVPSMGTVSLFPAHNGTSEGNARAYAKDNGFVVENGLIQAIFNASAEMVSLKDLSTGREFAAGNMNAFKAYKDIPRNFDAWDIDSNYELQPVELESTAEIAIEEASGLQAALIIRKNIMNSVLEQKIILKDGSRRLDFETTVDWHELHRLLKVEFPVDVTSTEAINEIQYGYITHPTHRSRLYDSDRFEVCNQRYTALCDNSHGAAILNDCKYGISVRDNAMQLTLLRAAAAPEMRADNGIHHFTYAFTVWEGDFASSNVVREAYALNIPLQTAVGAARAEYSAFSLDKDNIFIDTVKMAEDGSGDIIVRLYEAYRKDTSCSLHIALPVSDIRLCNLMENDLGAASFEKDTVKLHFHTFEVKTLRISLKNK